MFKRLSEAAGLVADGSRGQQVPAGPTKPLRYFGDIRDIELSKATDIELKANPSQELQEMRRRSTFGLLEEEVTRQKQRQEFYIRQINFRLRQVLSWPRFVPLDPYTQTLGNACQDGILLW
jgi:hypothetical protein